MKIPTTIRSISFSLSQCLLYFLISQTAELPLGVSPWWFYTAASGFLLFAIYQYILRKTAKEQQINAEALMLKAGFLPLPAWLFFATLAGLFAEDYSPVASHISLMTLQDNASHAIANIAALSAGTAITLFGIGIWRLTRCTFSSGAFCWIVFGVSMLANGIWPTGGPMHGLYIIGIFNILAPALSLLDIRNEAIREKLYGLTALVSLASVLYLWLLLNGFDPEGYSGLTQRIFGSINFLWPLFFAYHYSRSKLTD